MGAIHTCGEPSTVAAMEQWRETWRGSLIEIQQARRPRLRNTGRVAASILLQDGPAAYTSRIPEGTAGDLRDDLFLPAAGTCELRLEIQQDVSLAVFQNKRRFASVIAGESIHDLSLDAQTEVDVFPRHGC